MNYLWDTHALIYGMEDNGLLPKRCFDAAKSGQNSASCISLWEVALLVHKGRVKLKCPVSEWLDEASRRLSIIPITPLIAAAAYDLGEFHGDPADRLIAATALIYPATLITKDGELWKHPKLNCLWD